MSSPGHSCPATLTVVPLTHSLGLYSSAPCEPPVTSQFSKAVLSPHPEFSLQYIVLFFIGHGKLRNILYYLGCLDFDKDGSELVTDNKKSNRSPASDLPYGSHCLIPKAEIIRFAARKAASYLSGEALRAAEWHECAPAFANNRYIHQTLKFFTHVVFVNE